MSGVEIAALVGGLMGASAAGISALKDSKELRNGFSSTTMEVRRHPPSTKEIRDSVSMNLTC
jgi:gas vesicle protein